MQRILMTGATGFVGSRLLELLACRTAYECVAVIRGDGAHPSFLKKSIQIDDLACKRDWQDQLADVDVVIHCAARVHIMLDSEKDPLSCYRDVNVTGTMTLAKAAVANGVRRFVFISTVKVNGEGTIPGYPFSSTDQVDPDDPYARSKLEAEQALLKLAHETGMEVTIIRPPLVYGPGVKANFRSMLNWVKKGLPLPLGAVNNLRSLVYIDNLCDLIITCIDHPKAKNEIFLVSDGEDLSISALLRKIAKAQGVSSRLISIPPSLLVLLSKLFGKQAQAQRLLGSLQVDMQKTKELLGWAPLVSLDEGIKRTVEAADKG
nr:SDR family oxidoreductase [Pseudoalteromonas sp.]